MIALGFSLIATLAAALACPPSGQSSFSNGNDLSQAGPKAPLVLANWRTPDDVDNPEDSDKNTNEPADQQDDPAEQAAQAGGPWLGVQFGPVSDALAAHLHTKNGMVILNIVKGSPADEAGLQQYDVVTSVDGRQLGNKPMDLANLVKTLRTGEKAELQLIRGGKQTSMSVTVGERPENWSAQGYKYEEPQEAVHAQYQNLLPQLYTYKNGKLTLPDADAVKRWQSMIPLLREQEGAGTFSTNGGTRTFSIIRKNDDGQTIELRSEAGGKIKVNRTTKDGEKTTHVYANDQELKSDDAEAYKLYSESQVNQGADGFGKFGGGAFGWDNFDWNGNADFDKKIREAIESYQKTLEEMQKSKAWSNLNQSGKNGDKASKLFESRIRALASPKVSIQPRDDGSIEVRIRKGDDEMVQTYKNEAELKDKRPDLYKRYNDLRAPQEESEKK